MLICCINQYDALLASEHQNVNEPSSLLKGTIPVNLINASYFINKNSSQHILDKNNTVDLTDCKNFFQKNDIQNTNDYSPNNSKNFNPLKLTDTSYFPKNYCKILQNTNSFPSNEIEKINSLTAKDNTELQFVNNSSNITESSNKDIENQSIPGNNKDKSKLITNSSNEREKEPYRTDALKIVQYLLKDTYNCVPQHNTTNNTFSNEKQYNNQH